MSAATGMVVTADGVELWWRVDGAGPAVVLIPGRGDSSDLFPPDFTDALVAAGLSVVRFDPRDTGLSGDGGSIYRFSDMADDALLVADAAGVTRFHVVAVSMGGMIALDLAARHPQRVASIAFVSAMSPDPDAGIGEAFLDGIGTDPVAGTLASMGSPTAADEAWLRAWLGDARRRAPQRAEAGERHQQAAMRLGWRELADLRSLDMPVLVVHGTADRVLPVAHARSLAAGTEHSTLHLVDGMGHLPTRAEWAVLADLVIESTTSTG